MLHADILSRASHVLAGGPGTFSKHHSRYPVGIAPDALVSGDGCYVTGSDGKTYLDTVAALGPIILGYNHPAVTEAVMEQVKYGTSFSMLHPLEVEVAELLCELLPCAEMVRFMRNGTDATNAAVRLARAVTGKQHVIFAGYHGGAMDSYGITTNRAAGILPQLALYNHQVAWGMQPLIEGIPRNAHIAAIMVEVPPYLWRQGDNEFTAMLQNYASFAATHDALFILDEVVTFPRCSIYGAQAVYGVTPDLCTVSKGIANGFPIAALAGKRQYMERFNEGDVFVSYTFAGETTGLAACKATLTTLRDTDAGKNLYTYGGHFGRGLQTLFRQYTLPVQLHGDPWRLSLRWQNTLQGSPDVLRTWWMAEHARRGILYGYGVVLPMTCWGDTEVACLLGAADEVCALLRQKIDDGTITEAPCPVIQNVLSVR